MLELGVGNKATRNYQNIPLDHKSLITKFDYRLTDGDLGIGKMSGYYVPTTTGSYVFYPFGFCSLDFRMSYNPEDMTDEVTSADPNAKVF